MTWLPSLENQDMPATSGFAAVTVKPWWEAQAAVSSVSRSRLAASLAVQEPGSQLVCSNTIIRAGTKWRLRTKCGPWRRRKNP